MRTALILLVLLGLLAGGLTLGSGWIAARSDSEGLTCEAPPDPGRCRFTGTPIEMQGTPVFVEKFRHAFLPLKNPLGFVDARGDVWTAPPATLTDGASIPPIFEPLVGDRQSREYLLAATLHDAYTGVGNEALETFQTRPWQEVHAMFYDALIADGTPAQRAKILYAAVYLGGPRWQAGERSLSDADDAALLAEMRWCIEWIEATDPTREEIDAWMSAREPAVRAGTNARPASIGPAPAGG